ncbi:hypothetical protein JCM13210_02510 [Thermaerobacter litoralis]
MQVRLVPVAMDSAGRVWFDLARGSVPEGWEVATPPPLGRTRIGPLELGLEVAVNDTAVTLQVRARGRSPEAGLAFLVEDAGLAALGAALCAWPGRKAIVRQRDGVVLWVEDDGRFRPFCWALRHGLPVDAALDWATGHHAPAALWADPPLERTPVGKAVLCHLRPDPANLPEALCWVDLNQLWQASRPAGMPIVPEPILREWGGLSVLRQAFDIRSWPVRVEADGSVWVEGSVWARPEPAAAAFDLTTVERAFEAWPEGWKGIAVSAVTGWVVRSACFYIVLPAAPAATAGVFERVARAVRDGAPAETLRRWVGSLGRDNARSVDALSRL